MATAWEVKVQVAGLCMWEGLRRKPGGRGGVAGFEHPPPPPGGGGTTWLVEVTWVPS